MSSADNMASNREASTSVRIKFPARVFFRCRPAPMDVEMAQIGMPETEEQKIKRLAAEEAASSSATKNCPQCLKVVFKESGCDKMTCKLFPFHDAQFSNKCSGECGCYFCWKCGLISSACTCRGGTLHAYRPAPGVPIPIVPRPVKTRWQKCIEGSMPVIMTLIVAAFILLLLFLCPNEAAEQSSLQF